MKEILVTIPSRSADGARPAALLECLKSWAATTSGKSDIVIGLDSDDYHKYPDESALAAAGIAARISVAPNMRFVPKLNRLATIAVSGGYRGLMFVGDDHRFRTPGWEDAFLAENSGNSVCYGNDLLQGEKLPTAVYMPTSIISALGFMTPPCLQHMYADDFWKQIGSDTGRIRYFPDIVIEHMHFSRGKSPPDSQYIAAARLHNSDRIAYQQYRATQYAADLGKLQ